MATAVVAVALVAAGLAVLAVLRHNLIDSAGLQAESTARNIAAQVAAGTDFANLELPDADSQPVQVVSAERRVLAADDDLLGRGPMAEFSPAAESESEETDDEDEDEDESEDHEPKQVSAPDSGTIAFRDMRLPIAHDDTGSHEFRVAALQVDTPAGQDITIYAGASLAIADNAVAGVRRAMLIGLPLLLALVASVTWLVTRRALRPVEAIRTELAEIMGGDLSRRVPVPASHDEIARLATTTNTTLTALEESAQRQRRFIADAAHELRSPIASLRTQLEVAKAHPRLLELDGLIADSVRLEHLAADLLLLARLDAGEQPRTDRVDLAALIHDEITHRTGDLHPVRVEIPEDRIAVLGSRIQLGRVLANLVDNAQRHAATAVRISLTRNDNEVVLAVSDDGTGVPLADRDRIFRRFVRLDDARSREDGGAGLGLAIVRDVVERHRGEIRVDDSTDGGARFAVILPNADR
jgi:signal transduction histidine kinase